MRIDVQNISNLLLLHRSMSDEDENDEEGHQEDEEAVSSIMLFSENPKVVKVGQSPKKKNPALNTPQRILVNKSSPLLEGPLAGSVCPRKMYYTRDKDLLLCKEILLTNLHDTKKGSPLRKEAWNKVTRKLQTKFDEPFTHRSVRDRYNLLVQKYREGKEIQ